jgi:hypothetical protein
MTTSYYRIILERILSGDRGSVGEFMAFCKFDAVHWHAASTSGCKVVLDRFESGLWDRTVAVEVGGYDGFSIIVRISSGLGLRDSYFIFHIEDPKEKVFAYFQEHFKLVTNLDPYLFQ